jgi:hypothetical protein
MKIEEYNEEDGNVSFMVDSAKFQVILDHLRSKKLRASGHFSSGKLSEMFVAATIEKVNDALKDLYV